jgi:5-methylcytosine-specific restriction endonuclease McrA
MWVDVVRLWDKFGRSCAYCLKSISLCEVEPDHVVPLSRGGLNAVSNLLPSCHLCNGSKRDLGLREWAAWRAEVGWPAVVTEWADDDPRYSHLVLDGADMALIAA